jgi:hypothetical protein
MRSPRTALTAGAIAAVATVVPLSSADAATRTWHIGAAPQLTDGVVNSTLAFGPKNAWAFGGTGNHYTVTMAPSAYHWDGKSWRAVTLPKVIGWVTASSATSPSDIWAVTRTADLFDGYVYILHWNGKKWSVSKGNLFGSLAGVLALSRTNVWVFAVPSNDPRGDPDPGIWHFNGRTWTRTYPSFELTAASKVSATNAWAVGRRLTGAYSPVVAHYNGKKWTTDTLSKVLPHGNSRDDPYVRLTAIRASSAKSVWAAGVSETETSSVPILVHWNGKAWHRISVPGSGELRAIASDGHGGLWFSEYDSILRKGSLLHRSAKATWVRAAVTGGGSLGPVNSLSLIPGTTKLWGGGQLVRTDYSTTGVILSY